MTDTKNKFGRNVGNVLQDWVTELPLRYQGVLINSARGCDSDHRDSKSKAVTRAYRGFVFNSPAEKPSTYFEHVDIQEFGKRWHAFLKDCDHLPHHFVMHLIHAIQILGNEHPDLEVSKGMYKCYAEACRRLHVNVETGDELLARLTCNEETFESNQ